MARRAPGIERYLEWLERIEVPIEETVDIKKFQEYLEEEFAYGPKQIDTLVEAVELEWESLAPIGVRPRLIRYPWGRYLRFGIKGYKGLFGYKRMTEITGWKP